MKILPLSDLHLEFSALHIPNTDKADVTLLALVVKIPRRELRALLGKHGEI